MKQSCCKEKIEFLILVVICLMMVLGCCFVHLGTHDLGAKGLIVSVIGVIVTFVMPRPTDEYQLCGLGLEDGTSIDDNGMTVSDYNAMQRSRKIWRTYTSWIGLVFLVAGIVLQAVDLLSL